MNTVPNRSLNQSHHQRGFAMPKLQHTISTTVLGSLFLFTGPAFSADPENMVLIPRGEFVMGSEEHQDEKPHNVVLDAYYIDTYEVSNKDYKEFMKTTSHPAPAYWDDPRLNKPEQPVVGVNWYDASGYCEYKGKRLPTEAEWERAAKGPEGHAHYPWGHQLDKSKANYGQNVGHTTAVDSYPEGVSGYGAYNMAGNVFEWVADWYDPSYFDVSPAMNPQGPATGLNFANQGPVKVLKGGSWLAPSSSLHTSHRFWNQPENNSYGVGLGFRCAQSGSPVNMQTVQYDFMHALISMGQEKWQEALTSIEKALKGNPDNAEYLQTKALIMDQINKK
ncbi:MAG: SUMF1/EgtB/PvdO family nonheme iron enzyme [Nitrospirales bacterium]